MKLAAYLDKRGITAQAFATKMKISVSSVNKYRTQIRAPNRKMALRIARVTKGLVTVKDWQ